MSELLLPIGGGGGTSSDELTATKAQVLAGYTAVTKDSDDEAASGTMQNLTSKATKTYTSSNGTPVLDGYSLSLQTNSDGVKRIMIDSQYGGYIGAWTQFGISADKLGGVSQANVLNGQTFTSSNGIKLSGTMPDNSTRTSNGSVPGISSSYSNVPTREGANLQLNKDTNGTARINIGVPRGFYPDPGSSYINRPASDFGTATAAQVLSGKTFTSTAGIKVTGTLAVTSVINFKVATQSYNTIRLSWTNPAKGPWQGLRVLRATNSGMSGASQVYANYGSSKNASGSSYVDISGLAENTTYYFKATNYATGLSDGASVTGNAKTNIAQAGYRGKGPTLSNARASMLGGNNSNYAIFAGGRNRNSTPNYQYVDAINSSLTHTTAANCTSTGDYMYDGCSSNKNHAIFFGDAGYKTSCYNNSLTKTDIAFGINTKYTFKWGAGNSAYNIYPPASYTNTGGATQCIYAVNASLSISKPYCKGCCLQSASAIEPYVIVAGGYVSDEDDNWASNTAQAYNTSLTKTDIKSLAPSRNDNDTSSMRPLRLENYALFMSSSSGRINGVSSYVVYTFNSSLTQSSFAIPASYTIYSGGAHVSVGANGGKYLILGKGAGSYSTNKAGIYTYRTLNKSLTISGESTVSTGYSGSSTAFGAASIGSYGIFAGGYTYIAYNNQPNINNTLVFGLS